MQLTINNAPVYNESYYFYQAENVNSWWAPNANGIITRYKTETKLKMELCSFYNASDVEVKRLGITQTYYCPKVKEYILKYLNETHPI